MYFGGANPVNHNLFKWSYFTPTAKYSIRPCGCPNEYLIIKLLLTPFKQYGIVFVTDFVQE